MTYTRSIRLGVEFLGMALEAENKKVRRIAFSGMPVGLDGEKVGISFEPVEGPERPSPPGDNLPSAGGSP